MGADTPTAPCYQNPEVSKEWYTDGLVQHIP